MATPAVAMAADEAAGAGPWVRGRIGVRGRSGSKGFLGGGERGAGEVRKG